MGVPGGSEPGGSYMALPVVPIENYLSTCPTPYIIRTAWTDTVEFDRLVDIMAAGRTTLARPDIAGCLALFEEEVAKLVADGKRVKTRLGTFYMCASGKLESPDQAFTPGSGESSHTLRLHFRPNKDFEAELGATVAVARGKRFDHSQPAIYAVRSVKTEASLSGAPGDFIRIEGQRLKFDKAASEEGLFFINGSETRALQYASVRPSLCIAQAPPELAAGSYSLVLRSYEGGKELHEGRAPRPFTVE